MATKTKKEYHTAATYAKLHNKTTQWSYTQINDGKVETEVIGGKTFIVVKVK